MQQQHIQFKPKNDRNIDDLWDNTEMSQKVIIELIQNKLQQIINKEKKDGIQEYIDQKRKI